MHSIYDSKHGEQPIITGYVGAAVIVLVSIFITFGNTANLHTFSANIERGYILLAMIVSTFLIMLWAEYFGRKKHTANKWIKSEKIRIKKASFYLLISTLYRFSTLLIVFYLMVFILNTHYYFSDESFQITKTFFNTFFFTYITFGIPYIFFTLKYKWSLKYDFNDYAINLMLLFKGLFCLIYGVIFNTKKHLKRAKIIICSRKVKKILLTYLVIFFFLTLMIKFLGIEFEQFEKAVNTILSLNNQSNVFDTYSAYYLMLYHLLFVVDVSLAIVGYTFASRWLDNRTKSVDMSMGGWLVALMCYPPINSGFTEKFINYNIPTTHPVVTGEVARMIVMALTLFLFIIYVWATIAFSFKFSNLTNRGIVTTGPYSIIRHPAYITKNLAWWLENSFVLSNFWATVALLAWNIIYILRALTEERHLKKDPKYQEYCKKVKYRFIPGII